MLYRPVTRGVRGTLRTPPQDQKVPILTCIFGYSRVHIDNFGLFAGVNVKLANAYRLVSSACVQWPAVTTVARTPFRVDSTFHYCSSSFLLVVYKSSIVKLFIVMSSDSEKYLVITRKRGFSLLPMIIICVPHTLPDNQER